MSELSKITKLKKLYDYGSHMTPTKWAKAVEILCDGSNETDSNIIDITHSELYALRYNSQLIPGQKYRITDYSRQPIEEYIYNDEEDSLSIIKWFNPISDNSKITLFNIIVIANDNNSLNECATLSLKNPDQKVAIVTDETGKKIIYYHQDNRYIPFDKTISEYLTATDGVIDDDELIVEYKYLKDWIQVDKWTCKYNLDNHINDNIYEFQASEANEIYEYRITCYIQNGVFYIKCISDSVYDDYVFAKFKIKDVNQNIITNDINGNAKLNFKSNDCISYKPDSIHPTIDSFLNETWLYGQFMFELNSLVFNGTGYIYNMIDQWGNESDFDHSDNEYIKILEGDVKNIKYITNWTTGPLYKGKFESQIWLIDDYPIILNGSKDSNISLSKFTSSPEQYGNDIANIGLICTNCNLYKIVLVLGLSEIQNVHISNWNLHNVKLIVGSVVDTSSDEESIFGYTGSNIDLKYIDINVSDYIQNINDL